MQFASRILVLVVTLIVAACANKAPTPTATYPVSQFIWGGDGRPLQVVVIDPRKWGDGYDTWNIRNDYRGKPPALHDERTVRVISSNIAGYMNQPLCQPTPTIHVAFEPYHRWGKILYENLGGWRTLMRRQIQALIEANCAPGTVKAVHLAVFIPTPIWTSADARYLDRYEAKYEGIDAGRYVYYGLIIPTDDYALVHHDANGLARYMHANQRDEAMYARMNAYREGERRLQQEGLGAIFADYCNANPLACAGFAAMILQSGGSGRSARPGSDEYLSCRTTCQRRAPSEQAFCMAGCYQFIAR